MSQKITKLTAAQEKLKEQLTKEAYDVCVLGGQERPFTGALLDEKREGTFKCVVCEQDLFSSDTKFESGTGWPSFYDVINSGSIVAEIDSSHGMIRKEILCSNCGSHLGHVFEDGFDQPTGLRYCINSVALKFKPKEAEGQR
jgi:peptide-methionine (R)-S-oxide reductase